MLLSIEQLILLVTIALSQQYLEVYAAKEDDAKESKDGRSLASSVHRIAGGRLVESVEEYPSYLLVHVQADAMNYTKCGGVLLSDRLVLTAAHCVLDNNQPKADISQITVRAGLQETFEGDAIIDKFCWPADLKDDDPDIAVLRMKEKYPSDGLGRPVELPTRQIKDDEQAYTVGMGRTGREISGDKLSELPVKRESCIGTNNNVLCFRANDPKYIGDICKGDSGGPVLVPNGKGKGGILYGITSRNSGVCEKGKIGGKSLYANVYYLMPEIRNLMRECEKPPT